ncbi:MAG: hypothetical protein WCT49_01280 [Candidatus Paceibacterota bacterium]|nr:hypothetical protein [Candidatus Paceibacterota bacterium]
MKMTNKDFFDIDKPMNQFDFSIWLILFIIFSQILRFYISQQMHLVNHTFDILVILIPAIFIFSFVFTKRLISKIKRFSSTQIFISLMIVMNLGAIIFSYSDVLFSKTWIDMRSGGVEPHIYNTVKTLAIPEFILGIPLMFLCLYLLSDEE